MNELKLPCNVVSDDYLEVFKEMKGEIAFETRGEGEPIIILSNENVRKLIAWLQERLGD
jgi:hypothetical protein